MSMTDGAIVAAICHAGWVLVSAGLATRPPAHLRSDYPG